MMIQAMIRDLRAVERADLSIGPLTLVAGLNGAGKTSILSGVGRCLTGEAVPPWLNKSESGQLVRTGAAKGGVKISTPQGESVLAYPTAQVSQKGTPIKCSPIAAGLLSLTDLDSKKRTIALADLLGANPTQDDLANFLKDAGLKPDTIERAWARIQKEGWDAVHKLAAGKTAELKGAWQQVTKQAWGSKIGQTWTPDGYAEGRELAELEAEARQAREAVEQGIAAQASDAAETERLQALAGEIEDRRVTLQYAVAQQAEAKKLVAGAEEQLKKLPGPDAEQPTPHKCPACEAALAIEAGKIVMARAPRTAAEIKKIRDQRATLDGRLTKLRVELQDRDAAVTTAKNALHEAEAAQVQLGQRPTGPVEGVTADLAALREAETQANARLDAAKRKADADRIHGQIAANQVLIEAFGPQGVRARAVQRAVDRFNDEHLKPWCEAAVWRPIQVTETLDFLYGGRPYEALSESEQMRVRIAVQVAAATIDGSEIVIIDRADTLDQRGRGGLVSGLRARWADRPSLIGMTYSERKLLPPLQKVGGRVYWLENGTVEEIGAAPAKEAA